MKDQEDGDWLEEAIQASSSCKWKDLKAKNTASHWQDFMFSVSKTGLCLANWRATIRVKSERVKE